jgi:hypothetical protein
LLVRAEIARGAMSRGQHVDPEDLTRCLFGVARALRTLGLRETLLNAPAQAKPVKSLVELLRDHGKLPAVRP